MVAVMLLPRSTWTSVPRPVDKLTRLDPSEVRGIAVHWPGSKGRFANPTLAQSCRRLEAERRLHVHDRGWSDVAYLGAVDLASRVFDLRGAEYRSAANGDQPQNRRYGAVTVLVGIGEPITPEAVEGVRWWRQNVWLRLFPHATEVVGHRDLHGTECPGPELYRLIKSGAFTAPSTTREDDMALDRNDLDLMFRGGKSTGPKDIRAVYQVKDGPELIGLTEASTRQLALLRQIAAGQIDYDRLAAAIVAHGGTAADPTAIAQAVRAEFARELAD